DSARRRTAQPGLSVDARGSTPVRLCGAMRAGRLILSLLLAVCLVAEAAARRPRPEPCADGRFALGDVPGLGTAGVPDTLVLRAGMLALEPGCPEATARIHASRRRTTLAASWPVCDGVTGRVRLKARLAARTCDRLRGMLRLAGRPHPHRLDAARSPYDVPLDPRSPWPKFRRDAAQDGRSPIRPRLTAGRPWSFQTAKGIFSTPVVDGDGNVYVGSADRVFYALAPDGTVRWQLLTGEIIDSAALLDDRGRVYVGSGDGKLYAREA